VLNSFALLIIYAAKQDISRFQQTLKNSIVLKFTYTVRFFSSVSEYTVINNPELNSKLHMKKGLS